MSSDNRSALYSSATDNWPTPQDFYDRLNTEFNFELDVCSSRANHKAPFYFALDHTDAARRDGLEADWSDSGATGTVWMNPPYGKTIRAWMAKAFETAHSTGRTVVCLVPVRSSSLWWHDLVLDTGAEVRYVKGRLTFGDATNTAAFGSAVVIYRPSDVVGTPGVVSTMVNKVKPPKTPAAPVLAREESAVRQVSSVSAERAGLGGRTGAPTRSVNASRGRDDAALCSAGAQVAASDIDRSGGGTGGRRAKDTAEQSADPVGRRPGSAGPESVVALHGPAPRRSSSGRGVHGWRHATARHQYQA
jgi:site-specific DNA-methyltransferase (adenine-specific)